MINKKIIILIIATIFNSCDDTAEECLEDIIFKKKFYHYIEIVKETEQIKGEEFLDEFQIEGKVNAILFLNAVTGFESKIDDLHHPLYSNKDDLSTDLKKWENWYQNNKCVFTLQKADSLLLLYNSGKLKTMVK